MMIGNEQVALIYVKPQVVQNRRLANDVMEEVGKRLGGLPVILAGKEVRSGRRVFHGQKRYVNRLREVNLDALALRVFDLPDLVRA